LNKDSIETRNWQTKELSIQTNYLPGKTPLKILITSGASCPDAVV
jgi:4-hydroxy-3-methylbut-2-enyl diphosphate reductase